MESWRRFTSWEAIGNSALCPRARVMDQLTTQALSPSGSINIIIIIIIEANNTQ